jgi:hypothetical protein
LREIICFFSVLLAVVVTGGCNESGQPIDRAEVREKARDMPTSSLPQLFYEVLKENGRPGSLVARADCSASGLVDRRVPNIKLTKGSNLASQLPQILGKDNGLSWDESGGLVRVVDKSIAPDLLSVHLAVFKVSVRDPYQVVNALWSMPEVTKYMQEHNVDKIQMPSHIGIADNSVHPVDLQMQNVSVADVLDQSALRFKAMWLYMECVENSNRHVTLDLAQL